MNDFYTLHMAQIRPPVKWHGGKHYLAARLVALLPPHQTYVEAFGGAASVLLNKPPSAVEVYNDLDGSITRLFRILRDRGPELREKLTLTPYSELEFETCQQEPVTDLDELELARRDVVRWRQSIGGRGDGFSATLHRVRRDMADVVSGYLSCIDEELPKIIERLRTVQILHRPAIDVIRKWDSVDTVFYLDPPYVSESRTSKNVYDCEMTTADHRELAKTLHACVGKVILSGYPSDLYAELYGDWRTHDFTVANHAAGGTSKAKMTERVWLNWRGEQ
jgi:DNA adenine methylase